MIGEVAVIRKRHQLEHLGDIEIVDQAMQGGGVFGAERAQSQTLGFQRREFGRARIGRGLGLARERWLGVPRGAGIVREAAVMGASIGKTLRVGR